MPLTLTLSFETLSPLYLGNADQRPEIRAPSIKGALRAWARAVDPDFVEDEPALFGGTDTGQGQSLFLLRCSNSEFRPERVDVDEVGRRWQEGRVPKLRSGVPYLGYVFKPRYNDRLAIPPGTRFSATCLITRPERVSARQRRLLLASWWMLAHFGGLGARARRGFGSLDLLEWKAAGDGETSWRADLNGLPLLRMSSNLSAWTEAAQAGLRQIRAWFHEDHPGHTPHLGPRSWAVALPGPRPKTQRANELWEGALHRAGAAMQEFRAGRMPDRGQILDHLLHLNKEPGGKELRVAPDRADFGLPLTFRFALPPGRLKGRFPRGLEPTLVFVPTERFRGGHLGRHASPVHISVARTAGGMHAVFLRLDGDRPGTPDDAAPELRGISAVPEQDRRRLATPLDRLPLPPGDVLADFHRALLASGALNIRMGATP